MQLSLTSTLTMALLLTTPAGASLITTAQAGLNMQTGTSAASAAANYSDGTYTYTATANVTGSYFTISGNVHDDIAGKCVPSGPGTCPSVSVSSQITANVTDQLFLTAPSGGGTLQISYLEGLNNDFNTGGTISFNGRSYSSSTAGGPVPDSLRIPFTNGVPVPLTLSLMFGSSALAGDQHSSLDFETGSAEFALGLLTVLDSNMNAQPFSYYTASGTGYQTTGGTFTPEPSTFVFIAFGLGAIGVVRFRMKADENAMANLRGSGKDSR